MSRARGRAAPSAARAALPATRAVAAAAGAGALLLALAGCGGRVPPSGVIEAGDPAVAMPVGAYVYFLNGDTPHAVPRAAPGDATALTALRLLFEGPTAEEESVDYTTALPHLKQPPQVKAVGNSVIIPLPGDVLPLSRPALAQLACTVASAPSRPGLDMSSSGGASRLARPGRSAKPTRAPGVPPATLPPVRVLVIGDKDRATQVADACPVPPS